MALGTLRWSAGEMGEADYFFFSPSILVRYLSKIRSAEILSPILLKFILNGRTCKDAVFCSNLNRRRRRPLPSPIPKTTQTTGSEDVPIRTID